MVSLATFPFFLGNYDRRTNRPTNEQTQTGMRVHREGTLRIMMIIRYSHGICRGCLLVFTHCTSVEFIDYTHRRHRTICLAYAFYWCREGAGRGEGGGISCVIM